MAVTAKMVEILKTQLEEINTKLEGYTNQKQKVLANEESKDSPNDERLDMLSSQVECLESAQESVQNAINTLEDYE